MKHPASTAAAVLIGLSLLVGGAIWALSGTEPDEGRAAQLPPLAASDQVGFVPVTPKEQKKQLNLERTQREFKQIKEIGQEVAPDLYMIPDASGDPTYYSTQLLKGRGRNGEPLYMTAQFKKTRTLPLKDSKKYRLPEQPAFRSKPLKGALKVGKPSEQDEGGAGVETMDGGSGGTGGSGGAGSGSGQTDKDG